jgi:hypothetical protein
MGQIGPIFDRLGRQHSTGIRAAVSSSLRRGVRCGAPVKASASLPRRARPDEQFVMVAPYCGQDAPLTIEGRYASHRRDAH